MFDWSGKMQISQGKVREKSGDFDILCEWQPCCKNHRSNKSFFLACFSIENPKQ